MALSLQPITFAEACAFVKQFHSHHPKPQGWLFGTAVNDGERVVGVIMVGRPVSRMLDNGYTAEVTRCCSDGTKKNAASMLYGAAWRAARALGYTRLVTYTLNSELGTSLVAAGYRLIGEAGGGSWNVPSRPRVDKAPTQRKFRWEASCQNVIYADGTD